MIIIFIGPPGSGKGTQAKRLGEKMQLPHIATGDILRKEVKEASTIGLQAKDIMEKGKLVPDSVMQEIVKDKVNQRECANGFILDGFPRTADQAKTLDNTLAETDKKTDKVFNINIPEAVSLERLSGRRACRKCGTNYHIIYAPSKAKDICDRCGNELYQRHDDKAETIKQRFKIYQDQTASLIYYYRQQGKLIDIRGESSIERVFKEILEKSGLNDKI